MSPRGGTYLLLLQGSATRTPGLRNQPSCCPHRPGRDENLSLRVTPGVESFQASPSQKRQITFFGKDHFVHGKERSRPDDRKPDASGDMLTIRHLKCDVF